MRYYRGVDYFLYFEDFPHMGVPGIIACNTDGTVNIYINTLYSHERREAALRHELRHLALGHQYNDVLTIEEKEADADRILDADCVFGEDFSFVEYRPDGQQTREDFENLMWEKARSCKSREDSVQFLQAYA